MNDFMNSTLRGWHYQARIANFRILRNDVIYK